MLACNFMLFRAFAIKWIPLGFEKIANVGNTFYPSAISHDHNFEFEHNYECEGADI